MANAESNENKKLDALDWYRKNIKDTRYKPDGSSVTQELEIKKKREIDEEAASDHARVIYSSAFRRLQRKTQVFTLSKDAAVRSRLTHSLEVASVGRLIAQTVVKRLGLAGLEPKYCAAFVYLVETACLAHDIGNPPFGHFGESAIQEWFREKWKKFAGHCSEDKRLEQLMEDFLQFDGNPQGMRILTRLQGRTQDERRRFGMDLTYSQILTALKYPRGSIDQKLWKKTGFFESERDRIEPAWKAFGVNPQAQQRFPLAYLVEAADDISYCIGDMEDGIDQKIFRPIDFFEGIKDWTPKAGSSASLSRLAKEAKESLMKLTEKAKEPVSALPDAKGGLSQLGNTGADSGLAKDLFIIFKTHFTTTMIEEAALAYGDGSSEDIRNGTRQELLEKTDADVLLKTLKGIARKYLYPENKVQTPFLAGLKVTHGILDEYGRILKLPQELFALVRDAYHSDDRGEVSNQKLETLLPLLDALPAHYLDVYDSALKDETSQEKWGKENWEWFCRAHLIVDYLSGMTDDFAYRTYQVISGASLE